jgi:hypothetical protein
MDPFSGLDEIEEEAPLSFPHDERGQYFKQDWGGWYLPNNFCHFDLFYLVRHYVWAAIASSFLIQWSHASHRWISDQIIVAEACWETWKSWNRLNYRNYWILPWFEFSIVSVLGDEAEDLVMASATVAHAIIIIMLVFWNRL